MPPLENSTEKQTDLMKALAELSKAKSEIANHKDEMSQVQKNMLQKIKRVTEKMMINRESQPESLQHWERKKLQEYANSSQALEVRAVTAEEEVKQLKLKLSELQDELARATTRVQTLELKINSVKSKVEDEKENLRLSVERYKSEWQKEYSKSGKLQQEKQILEERLARAKKSQTCQSQFQKLYEVERDKRTTLKAQFETQTGQLKSLQTSDEEKSLEIVKMKNKMQQLRDRFLTYQKVGQEKINKHWGNFVQVRNFLEHTLKILQENESFIQRNASLMELLRQLRSQ